MKVKYKIKKHFRQKSLIGAASNWISHTSLFMKVFFMLYKVSAFLNLGFSIQKFFLIKPFQSRKFSYYESYMININPKNVEYVVTEKFSKFVNSNPWEFTMSGNWDTHSVLLKGDSPDNDRAITVTTINQLFVENIDYKECDQYLSMKEKIEKGQTAYYWCKDMNDLDRYFEIVKNVYNKIRDNNYKTQEELLVVSPDKINIREKGDEIRVLIDRKGRLVLGSGGTHRLLIADLLNIEEIPVIIEGAHIDWVKEAHQKYNKDILFSVKNMAGFYNEVSHLG